MQIFTVACPACGGTYGKEITNRLLTCEYCGTRFALTGVELEAIGLTSDDGFDDDDFFEMLDKDKSDAPMPEFAREACQKFLKGITGSYFDSSKKILRGLGIEDGVEVFLIHDDTMFKSGKNGFAITRDGIYCREFEDKTAHLVSWESFAEGSRPELDNSYIRQDETSLCYFTDNSDLLEGKIFELYLRLFVHARKLA